jgi:alkanesulfonate monooxygenase SsuD/methylene tetrahydromethanopterin reductase-like flavin-dependent oxidoreductase (luciferase family)
MLASVHLSTVTGEELLTVRANDLDPYVTVTVRQHSVDLTRDQARQAADALRACALTAVDATFGNIEDLPEHRLRARTLPVLLTELVELGREAWRITERERTVRAQIEALREARETSGN